MHKKIVGFFLILGGILLMILKTGLAPLSSFITWPFLLFFAGAFLIFFAFVKANAQLALLGGILGSLGLSVWIHRNIEEIHWSVLIGMLGVAFLLQFAINKNNLSALIGGVLVLTGVFAWPGIQELPFIAPVANILHMIWPVFVVVLGVIFLLKK
ncbi:hypothetical protein ACFO25_12080 [Paenactinomyces guangxiensis]|uniref:DUF5668 domain-containing protein n=1 Tax=Paenactinomyces guangxiensis TaxID=1490290 RepID=A0A7W1WUI6_9BACL|nr:hypothetical protein [Paenactinomyces guangxiensis]MBA4496289.1 hypothetical protein [Paenactinomyces guangxiensis]MBH8593342.1 hypothetical protein [Paenactinomyces guangxiensis]